MSWSVAHCPCLDWFAQGHCARKQSHTTKARPLATLCCVSARQFATMLTSFSRSGAAIARAQVRATRQYSALVQFRPAVRPPFFPLRQPTCGRDATSETSPFARSVAGGQLPAGPALGGRLHRHSPRPSRARLADPRLLGCGGRCRPWPVDQDGRRCLQHRRSSVRRRGGRRGRCRSPRRCRLRAVRPQVRMRLQALPDALAHRGRAGRHQRRARQHVRGRLALAHVRTLLSRLPTRRGLRFGRMSFLSRSAQNGGRCR